MNVIANKIMPIESSEGLRHNYKLILKPNKTFHKLLKMKPLLKRHRAYENNLNMISLKIGDIEFEFRNSRQFEETGKIRALLRENGIDGNLVLEKR
jgi:hypothetical protein